MNFINQNTNEPMTVQEARAKYSEPGEPLTCPLCGDRWSWSAGASADEGEVSYYYLRCGTCGTELIDDQ